MIVIGPYTVIDFGPESIGVGPPPPPPPPIDMIIITANTIIDFGPTSVGAGPPAPRGTFRLLKDHYIGGVYMLAGEIHELFEPWVPTADVEPLDQLALDNFYAFGPKLGAVIRTQFSHAVITPPVTYWREISPDTWALTGLGEGLTPVPGHPERVQDKEP